MEENENKENQPPVKVNNKDQKEQKNVKVEEETADTSNSGLGVTPDGASKLNLINLKLF